MLCAVLSGALVWALLLVPAGGADAAFTLEQVRCRSAVARSAAKLAHRAAVHTAKCHGRRDRSVPKATDGADCNRLDYGGGERVDSAEQALRSRVGGKRNRCLDASGDDLDPWHMGYRACPDPCGAPIGTADDLADCLVCLVRDAVEEMSETNLGGPAIGLCYGGSRDGLACSSCVGGSNDGSPCDDDSDCAGEGASCTAAPDNGDNCEEFSECWLGGECRDGRCRSPCDGGSVCKYAFCDGGGSNGQPCTLGQCADGGVCELVMDNDMRRCRSLMGKKQAKHFATLLKERVKCQTTEERAGGSSTAWCASANPRGRIGKVRARGEEAVHKRCDPGSAPATCPNPPADVPPDESCTDLGDVCVRKSCVFDRSEGAGSDLFEYFYALANASVTTTTVPVTSTTLPPFATWTEVHSVLTVKCVSCHGGGMAMGGLGGLDDSAAGYAALVGTAAVACPGNTLVVAGEPDSSYIVEKLEQSAPECGSQMPTGGSMTSGELAAIRSWISGGALND